MRKEPSLLDIATLVPTHGQKHKLLILITYLVKGEMKAGGENVHIMRTILGCLLMCAQITQPFAGKGPWGKGP